MPGKRFHQAVVACFLVLCIIPLAGFSWLAGPHKEKRTLSPVPSLSQPLGIPSALDAWFADRFGLRSVMVTGDHALRAAVLGDAGSDRVVAGRGGWLFFEPTMGDVTGLSALTDEALAGIADALALWNHRLADAGTLLVVAIAPNKATVYPENLPGYLYQSEAPSNSHRLASALEARGVVCAPWADALLREKTEAHEVALLHLSSSGTPEGNDRIAEALRLLYHATDSHWNNAGALVAYRSLMETAAAHRPELARHEAISRWTGVHSWSGDLAEMLYPACDAYDLQIDYELTASYETAAPMRTLEDLNIVTRNPEGVGTLAMYRDSFANALIPFLSACFETARYSRAVPYDLSLAEGADLVVVEIAERNIHELARALDQVTASEPQK